MRIFYLLIAAIGIMGWASGCNLINPSEVVPTYVHIDSFSMADTPARGSKARKITNVYVYFNNQSIGIFDLPVTFPVRAEAPGVLQVLPGIDFDGLTGYEVPYPFYLADTMTLHPSPGQVIAHTPFTRYTSGSILRKHIDFEDGLPHFTRIGGDSGLVVTTNPAYVFEGHSAAYIRLQTPSDSSVIQSDTFKLPIDQESYLELNYQSTVPIQIGLKTNVNGADYSEYLIGFNPRTTWGKVYIGTRSFASGHQGASYTLIIRARLDPDKAQTAGMLQVDNIKVISY